MTIRKPSEAEWEPRLSPGDETEPVVRKAGPPLPSGKQLWNDPAGVVTGEIQGPTDWSALMQQEYEWAQQNYIYQQTNAAIPAAQYWQDTLPAGKPYEEKTPVGKFLVNLSNWKPVRTVMDAFIFSTQYAEKLVGTWYQQRHDPWLSTPEARHARVTLLNMEPLRIWDSPLHNMERFEELRRAGELTPAQIRAGAAWHSGDIFFEATGFPAPSEFIMAFGAFFLEGSPFGKTAKAFKEEYEKSQPDGGGWLGRTWASLAKPAELFVRGYIDYFTWISEGNDIDEYEFLPGFMDVLKLTGMEHLGSKERAKVHMQRLTDFWNGDYVDTFGGLPEMLATREAIINGIPPAQAVEAYRQNLGANRFEAEIQDITAGLLLDPLDWLIAVAKPFKLIKAAGNAARLQRVAPQLMQTMDDLMKVVSKLDELEDVTRITDEMEALLRLADDANLDDVSKAIKAAQGLIDEGADIARVRDALIPIKTLSVQLGDMAQMTRAERVAMWLTGGDILRPAKKGLPRPLAWIVPGDPRFALALAPSARADDFLNTWYNSTHLLLRMAGKNVDKMVEWLHKGAAGAFGGSLSHMFITPMGRHVQNVLRAMSTGVDELYQVWKRSEAARKMVHTIADAMGENVVHVVTTAGESRQKATALFEALVESLARVGDDAPEAIKNLKRAVDQGTFKAGDLLGLGELFKATKSKIIPYTPELFRAAVIKLGAETAAELANVAFGVKEAKMLEKAANYVKAAESLVLLGGNPLYPVMNFFNNEVTMIARGLTGNLVPKWMQAVIPKPFKAWFPTVDDVLRSFDMNPARFREGFGITGADMLEEIGRALKDVGDEAGEIAEQVGLASGKRIVRSTIWGKPGKVGGWFLEKTRQVKDFRKLSAIFESFASERAFTNSLLKVWPEYWRPGAGFDTLDDVIPGLGDRLRAVDPRLADILEDSIRTGRRPQDIMLIKQAENLEWNVNTMMRNVAQRLGIDDTRIANFVSDDVLESIRAVMDDLGPRATPDEVRQAMTVIKDSVDAHIDELVESHIPEMIAEHASHVQIDGLGGVIDIYGQQIADATNRHIAHMGRLDAGVAEIMEMTDPVLRDRAWKALLADGDTAWARHWNRQEAALTGVRNGLRQRGIQVGDEFLGSFRNMRNASNQYIRKRNTLWGTFFEKLNAGDYPDEFSRVEAIVEIQRQLDDGYTDLIRLTDDSQAIMDGTFLTTLRGSVDDSVYRAATEWRMMLREMKKADMEEVLEFRQSIRGLTPDEISVAYLQHHEDRALRLAQMQRLEEYGRVMLNGDENALHFFRQNGVQRAQRAMDMDPAMRAQLQTEQAELLLRQQPDRIRYGNIVRRQDEFGNWIVFGSDESGNTFVRYTEYEDGVIKLDEVNVNPDFRREGVGTSMMHEFIDDMHNRGITEFATRPVTDDGRAFMEGLQEKGLVELVGGDTRPGGLGDQVYRILRPATPSPEEMSLINARLGEIDDLLNPTQHVSGVFVSGPAWNPPVFEPVVGHQWYMGTGMDELWFEQGTPLYNMLEEEALGVLERPAQRWADLPQDLQGDLDWYLEHVTGQMNDARLAAIRHAEGMRDGALLNYNRRYNVDNWLSVVGPYGFWWTHSMGRWALSTMENTHMIAAYSKLRQYMMDRTGLETGFPSRLKGAVKINLPWAPSEFGDAFINPFRSFGLPFEQFLYPFEQNAMMAQDQERGIQQILQEWVQSGEISKEQAELAASERNGPIYNRAKAQWRQSNEGPNMLDFMQMSVSPHLPISYALNIARGTPENLGALPPVRTLKNIASLLGIEPGYYDNTLGNARKALGLPAFDEWDDYRIDRELSNMAARNEISADEANLAMLNRSGRAYELARQTVNLQEGYRWANRLIGLNVHFYPEGEQEARLLTDEFYNALDIRDKTGDDDVLNQFFEDNPGFESRLALFDPPEERLKTFLVDQIWDIWFDAPTQHRNAIKDALGDQFTELFLSEETRSFDSIPNATLAMWARSMNQEVPDIFSDVDVIPIDFAPPEIANRLEAFYRQRTRQFPRYWELQTEYYKLEEGAPRRAYKAQNPAYANYVKWKWDFLYRNPELAPYIIDDPSKVQFKSIEQYREVQEQEPDFTLAEWYSVLGAPMYNLVIDEIYGEPLPQTASSELDEMAERLGLSRAEILSKIGEQLE